MVEGGYHAGADGEPNQTCALDGWLSSGRDAVMFGAETEDETTRDGGWILGGRLELTPGFGAAVSARGRR